MPIYDYVCGACGHLLEVIHGIHDEGPRFCPNCGVENRMKKAFAPTAVVFKGSGWAKKDRSATSRPAKSGDSKSGDKAASSSSSSDSSASAGSSGSGPSGGSTSSGSTSTSAGSD
jgi:putative FmdB family regulatory protein